MSVQTILAAGFLFLGGALLFIVSSLGFLSEWFFPFGLLFYPGWGSSPDDPPGQMLVRLVL